MTEDLLDRLAAYRPTPGSLDADWPVAERTRARARLLGAEPVRPLRFRPARRPVLRTLAPLAAGVAVLALIAGVLVTALSGSGSGSAGQRTAGGLPPAGRATDVPSAGQYAYRYDQQIDLDAAGSAITDGPDELRNRTWVSVDGDIVTSRDGSQSGCEVFARQGGPSMQEPTRDFFAGLPTDVAQLKTYLRSHVSGSSSRDEAVFVAVGDALRNGDLLATSELRAALVDVLGETPGVTVHPDQRDYLDRPATRLDFVNEQTRPGEIQSVYFDPQTYQLLEERDGSSGQPASYSGPSPAYDAPPAGSIETPDQLAGAAYLNVMVEEGVVDSIPFDPGNCHGLRILGGGRIGGSAVPTMHAPSGH